MAWHRPNHNDSAIIQFLLCLFSAESVNATKPTTLIIATISNWINQSVLETFKTFLLPIRRRKAETSEVRRRSGTRIVTADIHAYVMRALGKRLNRFLWQMWNKRTPSADAPVISQKICTRNAKMEIWWVCLRVKLCQCGSPAAWCMCGRRRLSVFEVAAVMRQARKHHMKWLCPLSCRCADNSRAHVKALSKTSKCQASVSSFTRWAI